MNLSQAALNKLWQQQSKPTQMHASKDLTGKIVDQGAGALSFDNFSRTLSADYSSSRILDSECPIWRQPTKSYPFVGVIFSTASMQHYIKKLRSFWALKTCLMISNYVSHYTISCLSFTLSFTVWKMYQGSIGSQIASSTMPGGRFQEASTSAALNVGSNRPFLRPIPMVRSFA